MRSSAATDAAASRPPIGRPPGAHPSERTGKDRRAHWAGGPSVIRVLSASSTRIEGDQPYGNDLAPPDGPAPVLARGPVPGSRVPPRAFECGGRARGARAGGPRGGGDPDTDPDAHTRGDPDAQVPEADPTPAPPARFVVLTQNPTCDGDMPYLDYEIEVEGTDATTATIIFLHPTDPEQDVVHADLPLSGRVLWPGAIPAGETGGPDWPGWSFDDGLWVEGDEFDWARPEVEVLFQVNPEAIVSVAYPSSTADCDPNAPGGDVGGATGTPNVTLPPTDTLAAGSSAPSGDSWRLILLAMAGIMAAALLLTPADAVIRRDRRRR